MRPLEISVSIMVGYCVALHLSWATIIFINPAALDATALSPLEQLFRSPELSAILLVIVALQATGALFCPFPWNVWLLLPQQGMLLLSSSSVIAAVYLGQFADGVERPHAFILADQLHIILAGFGHAVAIIVHGHRSSQ